MVHYRSMVLVVSAALLFSGSASGVAQVIAPAAPGVEKAKAPQKTASPTRKAQGGQKETSDQKGKKKKRATTHDFMRIRKNAKGRPVALETSITRYELIDEQGNRITVDLIGAVHIGEKSYYEALNKRFQQYDSMLYELVAPEGTVIPKGGAREGKGLNPVAAMQKGMQSALGLEFQLEHIDYTAKNFVHADMSPEEFAESMKKNEESISKYVLRAIGQGMAMQASGKDTSGMGMMMAMFANDKEIQMRRAFAKQIQQMDAGMVIFKGKDGSTIIDHRNAKCMEVLAREIKNGKRNLAIFYGAGHLPNMEERLINDFKMKRGGRCWLKAWSLESRKRDKKKK